MSPSFERKTEPSKKVVLNNEIKNEGGEAFASVRSLTLEEKLEPLFLNFTEKSFLQKFSVSFFKKRVPSIKRSGCSKSVERMPHDREVVGLNPVWRLAFILLCISSIMGPSIKSSGCGTLVEHMPFDHEVVGLSPARSCTYLPNDFSLNGS